MITPTDRSKEFSEYLCSSMEECFLQSCRKIQHEMEFGAPEIWDGLKIVLDEVLKKVKILQVQQKKGSLQYLAFSILGCGVYMGRMILRIDALDDGFYLDGQETAEYYYPVFLQEHYLADLEILYKKAHEKFIRIQPYELVEINKQYAAFYHSLIFRMLENMASLIKETVENSGIPVTDSFKVIFGEYMDKAIILYARGGGLK